MPRYWVIAPFENNDQYDEVWQFDIDKECISIGWSAIGDVSKIARDQLQKEVEEKYPGRHHTLIANMLWNFYHQISPGDVIIARRGLQMIAGVGTAKSKAQYLPRKNPRIDHPHFLQVAWNSTTRNEFLGANVFHRWSVDEIESEEFVALTKEAAIVTTTAPEQALLFGVEKELENFLIGNWESVFSELQVYVDGEGKGGQQYKTIVGPIDILAVDKQSGDFVVIELKRNRTSDDALGQVQRYMGWVKEHLCKGQQNVRGIIVCGEEDQRLTYAMQVTQNIKVQYYRVSFTLSETPPRTLES